MERRRGERREEMKDRKAKRSTRKEGWRGSNNDKEQGKKEMHLGST